MNCKGLYPHHFVNDTFSFVDIASEEIRADLQELYTYNNSDDAKESLGDKQKNAVVYECEDFND